MPIDEKIAKECIYDCWKAMKQIPQDKDALRLTLDALANHSRDAGHARRVCESLRDTNIFWPSIPEIITACEYIPDDKATAHMRQNCPHCGGDGWVSLDGPYKLSYAVPCNHDGRHAENRRQGLKLRAAHCDHSRAELQAAEERRAARA